MREDTTTTDRRHDIEYAVARALAGSGALPLVTQRILSGICDALGAELGEFWVVDDPQSVLRLIDVAAATGAEVATDVEPMEVARGAGAPGRAWAEAAVVSCDDPPAWSASVPAHGPWTAVAAPVVGEDRILAVLAFYARGSDELDDDTIAAVGRAGVHLGQFIERREAIAALRTSERRAAFLAEAASALGASLGMRETMDRLTGLLIPDVADACLVHLEGRWPVEQRMVASRGDPVQVRLLEQLLRRLPVTPGGAPALADVLASRKPRLIADIADEAVRALAYDTVHLGLLADLEPRSAMYAPLVARGRTLGALVVLGTAARPAYTPGDLELIADLAWTAASALENARLFEELRRNAETLQRGLLPEHLPEVPGVELAARYRAAGEGLEVGGDFYDVWPSSRRTWGVAIGDVSGKGAEAAALTGLARYTLRTLALQAKRPSDALEALNDAVLRDTGGDRFCSAIYGHLEPLDDGCRLMWASGGHPLPYVVEPRRVRQIGRPGTVLGVVRSAPSHDELVSLGSGQALVFYTDGVIEGRGRDGRRFGEERLADVLLGVSDGDADAIAGAVERAAVDLQGGELADDLAVLVIRVP